MTAGPGSKVKELAFPPFPRTSPQGVGAPPEQGLAPFSATFSLLKLG